MGFTWNVQVDLIFIFTSLYLLKIKLHLYYFQWENYFKQLLIKVTTYNPSYYIIFAPENDNPEMFSYSWQEKIYMIAGTIKLFILVHK